MAKSDGVYFDYQLMNETFTASGGMSVESLINGRFDPKPFTMTDTKGRTLDFMEVFVLDAGKKFYAGLMPLAMIEGRKESGPVLFDVDRNVVPFTMHAVTDKDERGRVEKTFTEAMKYQNYRLNNYREWLSDPENKEPLRLMIKPKVSVGFKRLAAIERGADLYVVIQPIDHLELFDDKDAVFVYRCDDSVSPPAFEPATKEMWADVLAEYFATRKKKQRTVAAPSGGKIAYDDFFETTTFVPADGRNVYEILLVTNGKELRKPFVLRDGAGREMTFVTEAVYSRDLIPYAVLNPVSEITGCDEATEIVFLVDDEANPPVLRVETDEQVCDFLFDKIYDIFGEDEEIRLTYPAAWEVILFNLDGMIAFCRGEDGTYCRFECMYTDEEEDKLYTVLCALSSAAGFKKGVEYVFSLDYYGKLNFGEPKLETDRETIARVMRERWWYAREKEGPSEDTSDESGLVFECRKCWTKYRGDVCPTCGTERKHKDYGNYPSCMYLNTYSDTYCRDYALWEEDEFSFDRIKGYVRCGQKPYEDTPCLLGFRLADDGYVVTGIGGCRAEHLSIPSQYNGKPVVGIEKSAFAKSALSYVRIPDSVKFVGASAFEGSFDLEFVHFAGAVTKIEERTFADCPKFRGMDFRHGIETIGKDAFSGCRSIREIQLPRSLISVEEGAFDGCASLGEIFYEGTAEEWADVGKNSERNDSFMRALIYFYSKEKPAAAGRFWHYTEDKYASRVRWKSYKNPVTDYSSYISNEYLPTYGLKYREAKDGYVVTGRGCCEEKNIVIPSTYRGREVVAVDKDAFKGDDVIRNLVVPESVGRIGGSAFQDCANLRGAIILGDVDEIDDMTFSGCGELVYLVFPKSCRSIGRHAFDDCDLLTIYYRGDAEVWECMDINDENEEWLFGDEYVCFYSETKPRPVKGHWHYSEKFKPTKWTGAQNGPKVSAENKEKAPDGVIRYPFDPAVNLPREEAIIGDAEDENLPHGLEYQRCGKCCAIAGTGSCTDIKKELVLPSMYNGLAVTNIGPSAFMGRADIASVAIPDGLLSIDDEAFRGCTRLTEVDIPDTVERIGNFAFSSTGLETVEIPQSAKYHLGKSVFANCAKLRSAVFGERMFVIPSRAFSCCSALEYVVLPHYCDKIEARAFEGCDSLKAVFFPSTEKEYNRFRFSVEKTGNAYFLNATMYFYSEERPEKSGNFWHYDDEDNPVIWDI